MKETKLDNGFTILTDAVETAKSVAISIFVNAGSYDEKEYPNGIAHYIEHMLFKGTTNRNAQEINEDIDSIGGVMNAYTDFEKTKYYVVVPYDQVDVGLDVVMDLIWNHTIPEEELERERTVILEEIKMYNDDPQSVAFDKLQQAMHQNYPNRQSIIGTPETVKSVTRENILDFIDEFYQPNNMVIAVTGNIDEDKVIEFVKNYSMARNGKTEKQKEEFVPSILKSETLTVKREIEQSHFMWGLFAPSVNDEDAPAVDVLTSVLGKGMSSRLFRIIREEKGLAYRVSVSYYGNNDSGVITGYTGLESSKIDEVKDIVISEFEKLRKEIVPEKELSRAIATTTGTFILGLEKPSSLNDYQGCAYIGDYSTDPEDYINKVRAVTAEDVKRVAQKYITPDNWQFVQVIPK